MALSETSTLALKPIPLSQIHAVLLYCRALFLIERRQGQAQRSPGAWRGGGRNAGGSTRRRGRRRRPRAWGRRRGTASFARGPRCTPAAGPSLGGCPWHRITLDPGELSRPGGLLVASLPAFVRGSCCFTSGAAESSRAEKSSCSSPGGRGEGRQWTGTRGATGRGVQDRSEWRLYQAQAVSVPLRGTDSERAEEGAATGQVDVATPTPRAHSQPRSQTRECSGLSSDESLLPVLTPESGCPKLGLPTGSPNRRRDPAGGRLQWLVEACGWHLRWHGLVRFLVCCPNRNHLLRWRIVALFSIYGLRP